MGREIQFKKIYVEFMDNETGNIKKYEQSVLDDTDSLNNVIIPVNPERENPEYFCMRIVSDQGEDTLDDWKLCDRILKNGGGYINELNGRPVLKGLANAANNSFTSDTGKLYRDFPSMEYEDITEQDFFGDEAILPGEMLTEGYGIWSGSGARKWAIHLHNLPHRNNDRYKVRCCLHWEKIDNQDIDVQEEEIWIKDYAEQDGSQEIYAYIDTNQLEDIIEKCGSESFYPKFKGRFDYHIEYPDYERYVYSFPVEICVRDTRLDENNSNRYLKEGNVSIDFGTSGTCAAINTTGAKEQLLTLSGIKKCIDTLDNVYENPTNLMLCDWSEVLRQWQSDNVNPPMLVTRSEDVPIQQADYDSGYTVADEFKTVNEEGGRRRLRSIVSQLKMLPYYLAEGKEVRFTPYNDAKGHSITIVDSPDKEDEYHFDPIAFYGYLLGRAINKPASKPEGGNLYRNYYITYPAKFNEEIRTRIKNSLEYGIKRSLPRSIREGKDFNNNPLVRVEMRYSEPEACMGAVYGKQIKAEEGKTKLFGVYDLGGGTMDFAFGLLRKAVGEEQEEAEDVLHFLGIDGDEKVGGEKLIHQMAYKIYINSQKEVQAKQIKFVKPQDEKEPNGFSGLLVNGMGDSIADSNLYIIEEYFARPLFQYSGEYNFDGHLDEILVNLNEIEQGDDTNSYMVQLRNIHDEPVKVELNFDGLEDFLAEKIKKTIEAFKHSMTVTFNSNKDVLLAYGVENFAFDDVNIFLGGNASKQHYVREMMEEIFPRENIHIIGEGQNNKNHSDAYAVNSKTAVAVGQLRLLGAQAAVISPSTKNANPAFLFNIGYISNGEFITVINKNENRTSWLKANRIKKENPILNLRYTTSQSNDEGMLKPMEQAIRCQVEAGKYTVYLRVVDERRVEYRLGSQAVAPADDEEVNESMIICFQE